MNKKRLDILLVEKVISPAAKKRRHPSWRRDPGCDGQRWTKPAPWFQQGRKSILKEIACLCEPGGLKLKKAIEVFGIDFQGKVVIDVGASTGGFTDCALQHGALKVIAIDVGYGQLAWKLRQDPRVVLLERTNIRFVTPALLGGLQADIITVDVSFISLRLVLPVLIQLLKAKGSLILLVKPQFEAGREKVGKKG